MDWVKGGQEGSLSSVTCDGDTGVDKDTPVIGPGGEPVTIPPKIQCGMGSILEMVENWAWASARSLTTNCLCSTPTTLLVEARDTLEGFLKTACGRYVLAGDQVKPSAEAYAKTDSTQKAVSTG